MTTPYRTPSAVAQIPQCSYKSSYVTLEGVLRDPYSVTVWCTLDAGHMGDHQTKSKHWSISNEEYIDQWHKAEMARIDKKYEEAIKKIDDDHAARMAELERDPVSAVVGMLVNALWSKKKARISRRRR